MATRTEGLLAIWKHHFGVSVNVAAGGRAQAFVAFERIPYLDRTSYASGTLWARSDEDVVAVYRRTRDMIVRIS